MEEARVHWWRFMESVHTALWVLGAGNEENLCFDAWMNEETCMIWTGWMVALRWTCAAIALASLYAPSCLRTDCISAFRLEKAAENDPDGNAPCTIRALSLELSVCLSARPRRRAKVNAAHAHIITKIIASILSSFPLIRDLAPHAGSHPDKRPEATHASPIKPSQWL